MEPAEIRDVVLNVRKPVVLRGVEIPWFCFNQTLSEWLTHLDASIHNDKGFALDCGSRKNGRTPQWERLRKKIQKPMIDFYKESNAGNNDHESSNDFFRDNWASYSYRYISELPDECRKGINFECFGFPDVEEDISFWIGSQGAHTPCHYDTYGCNIVVQVHGRKRWLLFPPSAKLRATRVPYEESSVYCEENFYSPATYSKLIGVENEAFHVVLEPGMALVVPPKWWHYVETLEFSLNFNTWIQLQSDPEEQISECLTRLVIQDYSSSLSSNSLQHIINPNEVSSIASTSPGELHSTLKYLLNQRTAGKRQRKSQPQHPINYIPTSELQSLLSAHKEHIIPVPKLSNHEFFQLMQQNSQRYDPSRNRSSDDEEDNRCAANAINRACNPQLIDMLKRTLEGLE
ncbi:HSPB1-associated protein 1 [Armigeres subalbatus]|uniref:HSPB1-associated protein 1 n=1 Tax=Armigeres subalbatus TaxID=124917 RepID=UPI002ED466C2